MLDQIQQRLTELYLLDNGLKIDQYLVTDRRIANAVAPGQVHPSVRETLLIDSNENECALSLFIDKTLIQAVTDSQPLRALHTRALGDFVELLEGLSHFNYAVFKATDDRQTSLFELELQAEVDKYFVALSLALEQGRQTLVRQLHKRLFDNFALTPGLSKTARNRYVDANYYAARYCWRLTGSGSTPTGIPETELRQFFRKPLEQKISRIIGLGW